MVKRHLDGFLMKILRTGSKQTVEECQKYFGFFACEPSYWLRIDFRLFVLLSFVICLAIVMLHRLLTQVAETVLPESQCGFRRGRSTVDMMFVARLLQEKCREQHRNLYVAFIDLTKAFDTVNRDLLWMVLSKFGCPPHFWPFSESFMTEWRPGLSLVAKNPTHSKFSPASSRDVF